MKHVLAALCTLAAQPAFADVNAYASGNTIYERCTGDDKAWFVWCNGYLVGVTDMAASKGTVCIPDGTHPKRLYDVIVMYLERNPTKRRIVAPDLILEALEARYACKE